MWYVYILRSERIEKYYTGHTENIENRLKQHNAGQTKSIKAYIPMKLLYYETFTTKQEAYKRELQIKSYKGGRAFKALIQKYRNHGEIA